MISITSFVSFLSLNIDVSLQNSSQIELHHTLKSHYILSVYTFFSLSNGDKLVVEHFVIEFRDLFDNCEEIYISKVFNMKLLTPFLIVLVLSNVALAGPLAAGICYAGKICHFTPVSIIFIHIKWICFIFFEFRVCFSNSCMLFRCWILVRNSSW